MRILALADGVGQVVQFIGNITEADLPDLYRAADVFVMLSTQEGFGIVFLEAAASGLSVVGGDRDGSLDALANGELGRAVDPFNEKESEEALIQAVSQGRGTNNCVSRFSSEHFTLVVSSLIACIRNPQNAKPTLMKLYQ